MRIRQQHSDEWPAVLDVVRRSFADADPRFVELVERIHDSPDFVEPLSYVAEVNHELLGNIILSKVPLHTERGVVQARLVAEFGVVPEHRHHGLGSALLRSVLKAAEHGIASMVLAAGSPSYYQRFGFRQSTDLGVSPPSTAIPDRHFLMMPLPQYDPVLDRGHTELPSYFVETGVDWPR